MRRPTPLPAPASTGAAGDADAPVEVSIPLPPRRTQTAPETPSDAAPDGAGVEAGDHDLTAPAWATTSPLAPIVPIDDLFR